MFKKLIVLLLTIFLLLPSYSALAETNNLSQIDAYKAIVKIVTMGVSQDYYLSVLGHGSGVIISSSGLVLTNYHVVTVEDDYDGSDELAGFNICLNQTIDQEPDCNYQAQLIAKDKDQDIALLQIVAIPGLSSMTDFPFLDLSNQGVNVNDELTALGFPDIGGDTISTTRGIVSGKLNKYNQNWIKTDAAISFGSSGGAAVNTTGDVIGITSRAHSDLLGDMGYIIDINSLANWINSNKIKTPQTNELSNDINNFVKKRQEIKVGNKFTNNKPPYSIVKPNDWKFEHDMENYLAIFKDGDDEGGGVSIEVIKYPFELDSSIIASFLDFIIIDNGAAGMVEVSKRLPVTINNIQGELVTISGMGESISFYLLIKGQYVFYINYDYGKNDKNKIIIDNIINSFTFNQNLPIDQPVYSYQNSGHNFSLSTSGNWVIEPQYRRSQPVKIHNTNEYRVLATIQILKEDDETKRMSDNELLEQLADTVEYSAQMSDTLGIDIKQSKADVGYKLNDQINNVIRAEVITSKSDKIINYKLSYIVRRDGKIFMFKLNTTSMSAQDYNNIVSEFNSMLSGFSWSTQIQQQITNQNKEQPDNKTVSSSFNREMAQRLSGKILLQVENNGEAWYIYPGTLQRYYLKDGPTAYNALREFGLGITNADLAKIPVGIEDRAIGKDSDNDGLDDKTEEALGTNPNRADSDGDGYNDGEEVSGGYNP